MKTSNRHKEGASIDRVLAALQKRGCKPKKSGAGWAAHCSAHDDQHASLSIAVGGQGQVLLKCHAGCPTETVTEQLGLSMRDLSAGDELDEFRIVAAYPYSDEAGTLLYEAVRLKPKDFRFRRPNRAGGWIWNLRGVRRVLYRLRELRAARSDEMAFCPEGEKDVDKLRGLGFIATTNPGGAGKWREEYNAYLASRRVIVLADNDPPGRKHAQQVAKSLYGTAKMVKVLELPGLRSHGDISDWLDAGGTAESLRQLAERAPEWKPGDQQGLDERENTGELAGSESIKLSVAAAVDTILAAKGVPARIKRREAAKLVVEDLSKRGDLIQTPGGKQFWFERERRHLHDLDSFSFRSLFIERYQINPMEPEFRHVLEAIRSATRERGRVADVYRFAFYDPKQKALYISAGLGRVARLNGHEKQWVENGIDGVLFEDTEEHQTIPDDSLTRTVNGDPIDECILGRVNFSRGSGVVLSPDAQRLILRVWILALFFPELLPSRVLLLLYGEKGSGKTSTLKAILKLLLGPKANVTPLTKEDGFNAAVSQEFILVLDNVDSYCRWIEDRLATVATGQTIRFRKLYTTNEMLSFPTRCFLALTARTPRFRRDDIVDRLTILRVDRLERFQREAEWYAEVEERRSELWAQLLQILNQVLLQLQQPPVELPDSIRMADWGFMALTIGKALGQQNEVRTALEAAEVDKAHFLLEADELYDLLHSIAHQHRNRWWKAGELFVELRSRAERIDVEFTIKSPKSLGRILHRLEPALKFMIRFEIRSDPHEGQASYLLGPLNHESDTSPKEPNETGNEFHDPDF